MHREIFEDNDGQLIDEERWHGRIEELRSTTKPSSATDLDSAIQEAVRRRSTEKTALLLSGGVDSSLLALLLKKNGPESTAFCVGLEGSQDLISAEKAARQVGVDLARKTITLDEMERIITRLKDILTDAISPDQNLSVLFGVAAVELAAIEMARDAGFKNVMGGLGSEEIFAGYERHAKAHDINEECWSGLHAMRKRDLIRDACVAKATGARLLTPYLDQDLIKTAMGITGDLKMAGGIKKAVLRASAVRLGLPTEFAERPKQAAQYGSRTDKAIERLAKTHGFPNKHGFLSHR